MDAFPSGRVVGVLLAVLALAFWYEAPTWARADPSESNRWPFANAKRRLDARPPDARTVRVRLIVLRSVAIAVFIVGLLQLVGVEVPGLR